MHCFSKGIKKKCFLTFHSVLPLLLCSWGQTQWQQNSTGEPEGPIFPLYSDSSSHHVLLLHTWDLPTQPHLQKMGKKERLKSCCSVQSRCRSSSASSATQVPCTCCPVSHTLTSPDRSTSHFLTMEFMLKGPSRKGV